MGRNIAHCVTALTRKVRDRQTEGDHGRLGGGEGEGAETEVKRATPRVQDTSQIWIG